MNANTPIVEVTVYIWGDLLDPDTVSTFLGVPASFVRRKGEKRKTPTNREITAKTSVWSFTASTKSANVSDHIQELVSRLDGRCAKVVELTGVQGAYIDVLISVAADDDSDGSFQFRLTPQDISGLQVLGLPVDFKVDVVKE